MLPNINTFRSELRALSTHDKQAMVAGMKAIIEENYSIVESVKKQKWYQRIFYGIIGRNKANLKYIENNNELLKLYAIEILAILVEEKAASDQLLGDMIKKVNEVYSSVVGIKKYLVMKLSALEKFTFITTDIINKQFDTTQPMNGVLHILMNMMDLEKQEYHQRIKDTMLNNGFDINSSVSLKELTSIITKWDKSEVDCMYYFTSNFENIPCIQYINKVIEVYHYDAEGELDIDSTIHWAMLRCNIEVPESISCDHIYSDVTKCLLDECTVPHKTSATSPKATTSTNSSSRPVSRRQRRRHHAFVDNASIQIQPKSCMDSYFRSRPESISWN